MPLTGSQVKQTDQQPSTSTTVRINDNCRISARRGEHKMKKLQYIDMNDNPLLNNVVLMKLFGYAKETDLKNCRLVCRHWNALTLPFIRSEFQVRIFGSASTICLGQARKIGNFIELINSNTGGIPFERFILGAFDTAEGFGQQFVQTCGILAKEIILETYDETQIIENVAEILKSVPKLESFTMPMFGVSSKNDKVVQLFSGPETTKPKLPFLKFLDAGWINWRKENICPTFYVELFSAAANISTLHLPGWASNVTEVLETIEKLGRESTLENLKVAGLNEKHLEVLRRMAKKPKGLILKKIDLSQGSNDHFLGFELVEIFKNSLIALRVNCQVGSAANSNLIKFPRMPKLKRLHLFAFHRAALCCENFGNIFPVMKKLCIDFTNTRNMDYNFLNGDGPCPTYKSSIFRCVPIRLENLNQILIIFPTLRFFECQIKEEDGIEVIRKIWTHMKQLEGLIISGNLQRSEDMDSLVTGISVLDSKKMGNLERFFESLQHHESSEREIKIQNKLTILTKDGRSELPSIRNLGNLRSLTLKLNRKFKREKYLTDLSGYFGLYSLKDLKHLHISDSELSRSCCEVLAKDLGLINRKFISSFNREIIPTVWNHKTPLDYPYSF